MTKRNSRCPVLCIIFLFVSVVFLAGCETLRGAAEGFKKDWDSWTEWDKEFQEVLW